MFSFRNFRRSLICTTALFSALTPAAAHAATTTISTAVGVEQFLGTGDNLTVTDKGSITSAANGASVGFGAHAGTVDNSGAINGDITGLLVDGELDHVINSGTINGTFEGIFLDGAIDDIINKAGATISGGSTGIRLDDGNISGGVVNNGLISGDTGISVGGKGGGTIAGGITLNDGGVIIGTAGSAIEVLGGGKISNSLDLFINGGEIIGDVFGPSGKGSGGIAVMVDGDFTTEGNFDVSSLAVSSGNTLTIGAFNVFETASMIATKGKHTLVFDTEGVGGTGEIIVDNGAVNLTGTAIEAHVTGKANKLSDGLQILIADGTDPIIGGPGGKLKVVIDNSSQWDFKIGDGTLGGTDDSDLFLFVYAQALVTPGGGNSDVMTVLQGLSGSPDPDIQNAIANANGAGDPAALLAVLGSMQSGEEVSDAAIQVMPLVNSTVDDHLDSTVTTENNRGLSSGNSMKGLNIWGQVFGQVLDQDARGGQAGYDAHTAGLLFGIESETLIEGAVTGMALSYGRTNVDSSNANSEQTDIDSYQLSLYAQREFTSGFYARGLASYSFNNLDTTRFNVGGIGGPTALGDFDAHLFGAQAEAGRRYSLGHTVLVPNLLLNWQHFDPETYTETGAGGLNLTVNGSARDKAEIGAGLKAKWGWTDGHGNKAIPQVKVAYRYDLVGDNFEATSAFTGGGGSFTSQGLSPARGSFSAGASFVYETQSNWEFQASYDADLRQDFIAHSGTLKATYRY